MDFIWAIRQLKQGKKVRRDCWDTDTYVIINANDIETNCGNRMENMISQIEATDWIYYNKPFDLSNRIQTIPMEAEGRIIYDDLDVCLVRDVHKFIEKLKDNIVEKWNAKEDIVDTIDKLAGERLK